MSGRKVFTAGEVLQAADVNDFLMDQSVMVFAGTAARGSAIPSPTEGMVTYRSDDDAVEVYDGSSWNAVGPGQILQVVSTTKTDTFSTSSTSFTTVTGLTAAITPSSTSSKIMIIASVGASVSTNDDVIYLRLAGGNATDFAGDASSSRTRTVYSMMNENASFSSRFNLNPFTMTYLDSPATTSEVTYSVQVRGVLGTVYVNRSGLDTDSSSYGRGASSITVMEVAG